MTAVQAPIACSPNNTDTDAIQRTARTAGLLYALLIPLGIFGILYVPSTLLVEGDAGATVRNVAAHEVLFRIGVLSALLAQVVQIFVALFLYKVLKPAGRDAAVLMVVLSLLGVPIAMLNELNQVAVLAVLSESTSLVALFLSLHHAGVVIAQVFWGLWLLPLGYLVFTSGFLPKAIGPLLVLAGLGYVADSVLFFAAPEFDITLSEFTFLGELLITGWLLVKGVNVEAWRNANVLSRHPVRG